MDERSVFTSKAESLQRIMDLGEQGEELWSPAELGAILEHQLRSPIEADLRTVDDGLGEGLDALEGLWERPIRTFGELLRHPRPPVALLELTKRFAKACRKTPEGPLPDEVATVLYVLSVAAALARCGRRITKADDETLRYSVEWALERPWLDELSRDVLRQAQKLLRRGEPDRNA